ncbi:transmembrane and ubiquitin-like domain-containing protein 1 [Palaemon carinicauda]|uniref:transmembrane and ubiquitin-like domain-containing protein 1 n=1 Tax=Palaemon carinicauda TaxID=392227 RepID=UPI0035B6704E
MLNFAGFQDALSVALVIIIVSFVIAVAWLSTNVREQPLIATAVVVFQSGVNTEGDQNSSVTGANRLDNQSGGNGEGEGESAGPVPLVKENESAVLEVRPETGKVCTECKSGDVVDEDSKLSNRAGEMVPSEESEKGAEALRVDKGLEEPRDRDSPTNESSHSRGSGDVKSPSCTTSSTSEKPHDDPSQEMEIRNRRLKHFVTMGGSHVPDTHHETCASQGDVGGTPSPGKDNEKVSKDSDTFVRDAESSSLPSDNGGGERPPGSIRIRLKFLDETQKFVFAQLTEQVGSFKRQHFSIEMDANRRIRLIFNGQLLSQDTSTLAQYGLFDNCVVHCHVSQPQQMGQNSSQTRNVTVHEDEDAYVTNLLAPLLYCVMVVMWFLRYEYSHLFNTMSTVILLFLTALLLISTYLLYITQNVPGSDSAAQISSHHQLETDSLL